MPPRRSYHGGVKRFVDTLLRGAAGAGLVGLLASGECHGSYHSHHCDHPDCDHHHAEEPAPEVQGVIVEVVVDEDLDPPVQIRRRFAYSFRNR